MIAVDFQGKPFNKRVIQVYASNSNAEEAEVECFYEDLQDLLELTPKKDVLFITGDWNAKVGSQEIPKITPGQIWPWNTKRSRAKANRLLPREHTGHSKYPPPTTQDFTHGHHEMVNTKSRLIILFAAKDKEALKSQQKQDWELIVAQIMNSLLPKSD